MIKINSFSSLSEFGPRPNQEDYIYAPQGANSRILVLCDGMGGHGHGEVASKTVAESVYNYLDALNAQEYTAEMLQDAVDSAILELRQADIYNDPKPMGTTLVVVAINRMNILVGHIGDSRAYLFDNNGYKKFRTKDHSKVQEAVDAEILTEEEAWSSPKKNLLTRCILSSSDKVKLEVDDLTVDDGDLLFLCSDGVTDALRDADLQSLIIGRDANDIAQTVISNCETATHDNFSAIIVSLSQDEKVVKPVVVTQPQEPTASKKFCSNCGREIKHGKYCQQCSSKDNHQESRQFPPQIPVSSIVDKARELFSKYKSYWIGGIGLIVGGCVGLAIGFAAADNATSYDVIDKETRLLLEDENRQLNENFESMKVSLGTCLDQFQNNVCDIDTLDNGQPVDSTFIDRINKEVETLRDCLKKFDAPVIENQK